MGPGEEVSNQFKSFFFQVSSFSLMTNVNE